MKRSLVSCVVVAAVVATAFLVHFHRSSGRITVLNRGLEVVAVTTDRSATKTLLGQNGIGYFDGDTRIRIGAALVSVDHRVEVLNTGPDVIRVAYNDGSGARRTTMLGERGIGYFSTARPIELDDVRICVGHIQ